MRIFFAFFSVCFFSGSIFGQYVVKELDGGPFSKILMFGYWTHKGSTLQSKILIFNHSECGLEIRNLKSTLSYGDRAFRNSVELSLKVTKPVVAVEYRLALYDVFGEHLSNLGDTEIKDLAIGEHSLSPAWESRDDFPDVLTTVAFIYRVRFADGTFWKFDIEELGKVMSELNLEKVEEKEDGAGNRLKI